MNNKKILNSLSDIDLYLWANSELGNLVDNKWSFSEKKVNLATEVIYFTCCNLHNL